MILLQAKKVGQPSQRAKKPLKILPFVYFLDLKLEHSILMDLILVLNYTFEKISLLNFS